MAALFDVRRRPAESVNEKIPKPLLGTFEIVGRIHRSEDVVRGHLAIERLYQALESVLADGGVNFFFFH